MAESILKTILEARRAGLSRDRARHLLLAGAKKQAKLKRWPEVELVVKIKEYERYLERVYGPG